jgi:hypothetical protein
MFRRILEWFRPRPRPLSPELLAASEQKRQMLLAQGAVLARALADGRCPGCGEVALRGTIGAELMADPYPGGPIPTQLFTARARCGACGYSAEGSVVEADKTEPKLPPPYPGWDRGEPPPPEPPRTPAGTRIVLSNVAGLVIGGVVKPRVEHPDLATRVFHVDTSLGKRHLKMTEGMTPVVVNGQTVTEADLEVGDVIEAGRLKLIVEREGEHGLALVVA